MFFFFLDLLMYYLFLSSHHTIVMIIVSFCHIIQPWWLLSSFVTSYDCDYFQILILFWFIQFSNIQFWFCLDWLNSQTFIILILSWFTWFSNAHHPYFCFDFWFSNVHHPYFCFDSFELSILSLFHFYSFLHLEFSHSTRLFHRDCSLHGSGITFFNFLLPGPPSWQTNCTWWQTDDSSG